MNGAIEAIALAEFAVLAQAAAVLVFSVLIDRR
jgi:hypothetical protein